MSFVTVLIGAIILIGLYTIATYNGLVGLKNRVKEAFSDIGVQQKRRHDLIPNLVETVKGYASHESKTLQHVTEARTKAIQAAQSGDAKTVAAAENALSSALKSVFAVAEQYPDLKANQNFLHLQQELVDAEDKIQAARRFFNQNVQLLKTKVEQFPSNMIANAFGFTADGFIEIDAGESAVPQVKF